MSPWNVVSILLGIGLLYFGGEWLVANASRLAQRLGWSPLVVGLTVVAFGTSSPELAAALAAVFAGSPTIVIGNVIGSNSANIGLILGLSALLRPIETEARFLRRELPFMIGTGILVFPLFHDGRLSRLEGLGLLALLAIYLGVLFREGEQPTSPEIEAEFEEETAQPAQPMAPTVLGIAAGTAMLVFGARFLVDGAVAIALWAGLSERVIGLTLVAFGTSLPELAACLVASHRGHGEIGLGNLVGSNVFNVLAVLGVTSVQPR